MRNIFLIVFLIILSFSGFAQERKDPFASLTSETKYVDEYPFKTRVVNLAISVQRDISEEDSPTAFFFTGGYEFRKLILDESVYWSVAPRLRVGWLSDEWDFTGRDGNVSQYSFNALAWGVSFVPSIALILEPENYLSLFLEGEVGIINYHTEAELSTIPKNKDNSDDLFNLNLALRAGFRGNLSPKLEGSVWVGLSNINSHDANRKVFESGVTKRKYPLFGEVGIGIGF